MSKFNLTDDELDILRDAIDSDAYKVFIKIAQYYSSELSKDVLKYTLDDLSEKALAELAFKKTRAQGAEKLLLELRAVPAVIKQTK